MPSSVCRIVARRRVDRALSIHRVAIHRVALHRAEPWRMYKATSTLRVLRIRSSYFTHTLQHGVQPIAARGGKLAGQAELVEPVGQVEAGEFVVRHAV